MQTRGCKRLGKENIQQSCLLFYFLRYDPEEGQTITFYSGTRKRRLAAAETERTNVHCDISSISSNLKATWEISAEEVVQCFRGVYLLLTFSVMKRWMEKKKKQKPRWAKWTDADPFSSLAIIWSGRGLQMSTERVGYGFSLVRLTTSAMCSI